MKSYLTQGTCSKQIDFEIEDGVITHCQFHGGCPGNTAGVAKLVIGRKADEVIPLLEGVTSCPAQLAKALAEALAETAGR